MTGFAVRLDEVSKRYRPAPGQVVTALDRVSLAVEAASIVALMGPSGSGKSTLLHLVGAMDTADEGRIRVGDRELTRLSRREQTAYRRTIGFVFQRFHLLPALTVVDNVGAPLLPRHGAAEVVPRAKALLDAVGLDGKGDVLPSRLSGGEQQRVAIARALLNDPGLVLADEPTGNLDSATGAAIVDLLLRLREERGMTILVATHDRSVAERCDRIVRLEDGRTVG
jgi:putative ABC transport system ATP-binding protein